MFLLNAQICAQPLQTPWLGQILGPSEFSVQFILLSTSGSPHCPYESGNGVDTAYVPLPLFQG